MRAAIQPSEISGQSTHKGGPVSALRTSAAAVTTFGGRARTRLRRSRAHAPGTDRGEATARIGAKWNEHTDTRTTFRNSHRDKTLSTQAGDPDLSIPKPSGGELLPWATGTGTPDRPGSNAVIMAAYVHDVSTRSAAELLRALGADTRISKGEVPRICQDLDGRLTAFRGRPADHVQLPYVQLDATYCKASVEHQIMSRTIDIGTDITEDGGREVLGDSETELFWTTFLPPRHDAAWPGHSSLATTTICARPRPSARSCSGPPINAAESPSRATCSA
ncbi:transposase [Streptomyces sp. NPDC101209]|uniref:transposase n=1 Tax=Streptomyces sp. NPDC101209 TaxID=3366129 RepID=UPI00382C7E74